MRKSASPMQNQKVIEQLGYTAKEARVYLAALSLGEAHISDIADKVKMPRSSVQAIVDTLHKDGLMNFYVMRRYKYWVAENPERLLFNLKRREETVQEALPSLIAIKKASRNRNRKKASAKSLGFLQMLADASPQPILIVNDDIEIEYVNAAWEKQFGYSLTEVHLSNPSIFQSGMTPQHIYTRMWRELDSGKMFQSDEIIDKKKDGSTFNLLTTIFPLEYNNQKFFVQILDTISARTRVEQLQKSFMNASLNSSKL